MTVAKPSDRGRQSRPPQRTTRRPDSTPTNPTSANPTSTNPTPTNHGTAPTVDELFDWLPADTTTRHDGERLQKVLAQLGWGSRRLCEEMIEAGRVRVNDDIAILGRRVNPETDRITVDGVPVGTRSDLVHYLLHKPTGVVTTASDPQGRPTVVSLVPAEPRVFPVGRLDFDTSGLLLLTNDGELTNRLTHPRYGVEKEYVAEVQGRPNASALRRLRDGVELEDGFTAPARAQLLNPSVVRLVIHEGRNRQVRRMLDAVGHPVRSLVRTRIGPLADRHLAPGEWRILNLDEVVALGRATTVSDSKGDTQD